MLSWRFVGKTLFPSKIKITPIDSALADAVLARKREIMVANPDAIVISTLNSSTIIVIPKDAVITKNSESISQIQVSVNYREAESVS